MRLTLLITLAGPPIVGALHLLAPGLPRISEQVLTSLIQALAVALVLTLWRFWRPAGFVYPTSWRSLWLFLPLVILALLPLVRGIQVNQPTLLALTIISLLVAFWKASVNNESESWSRSPLALVLPDVLPAIVPACSLGRRDGGDRKGGV